MDNHRIHNVEKDYQKLFSGLESPVLPAGLYDAVLMYVEKEARRASLMRLAVLVPLVFISSAAVIISFQYLARQTVQSGLSEYLSILFSDGGAILSFWKEFLLAIAERAPVIGMSLFLAAILALLGSLRSTLKNARTMFHSAHGAQLAH